MLTKHRNHWTLFHRVFHYRYISQPSRFSCYHTSQKLHNNSRNSGRDDDDDINYNNNYYNSSTEHETQNWREENVNTALRGRMRRDEQPTRASTTLAFADDEFQGQNDARASSLMTRAKTQLPFSDLMGGEKAAPGSFVDIIKPRSPVSKHDTLQYKVTPRQTAGDMLSRTKGGKLARKHQQTKAQLTKKQKKQRKSRTWTDRPLEDERYVDMEQRTEKLLASLSPEEKKRLSSRITPEKLQRDLLPFEQPELNHAFMTGRLLSKDLEEKLYFVENQQTGDVDIVYAEDPHWLKFTMTLLSPFPSSSVNDPKRRVLEKAETDPTKFFMKIDKSTGLPRAKDTANYNYLMMAQGYQGKMALMLQTYKRMRQSGVQPDAYTFSTMINAFARRGNFVVAHRIFEELITKTDIKPTQAVFAAMVSALVRAKKLDQAFHVMESMRAYDLEPSTAIHTMLIAGCVMVGNLPRAWEHFELMVSQYSPPDEITYTIMVNAAAEDGRVEKAFSLMADMEQLGLFPNEVTYNTLIKACAKRRDMFHKAFEVAQQMQTHGHEPDIYTYNTLIHICGRRGEIEKAYELLETMKSKNVQPNDITYNTVINMFGNSQLSNTERRRQNLENALALFDQMVQTDVPINLYTMNCTLKCFAYALYSRDAEEFFRTEFANFGTKPNSMSYSIMMRMYVQLRQMDKAMQMVEEMEKDALVDTSLSLTYDAYKHIAIGFAKTGEHDRAFKWLREMHTKYGYMLSPMDLKQFKMSIRGNRDKAHELKRVEELSWLDDIVDDSSSAMAAASVAVRQQRKRVNVSQATNED